MKTVSIISIAILLVSCTTYKQDQNQIMRTIEANIQLPSEAKPIEAYSRNYTRLSAHKVFAIFVLPFEPRPIGETEDYGCDVMTINEENGAFGSRPCTESEIEEARDMDKAISRSFGTANDSRWFKSSSELPLMDDGGCAQIEIIFDLRSETFERVRCNGS